MSGRFAVGSLAIVAGLLGVVLIIDQALERASPEERSALALGLLVAAIGAGLVGWTLTRLHRRASSLRWTVIVVAITSVAVASAVVAAAANAMILAPADLRLVLAALLLGVGLGVMLAVAVTGPLTADLQELTQAAQQVAGGDLSVRVGLERADEVGDLAGSLDRMVEQLAQLEDERARNDEARQHLLTAVGHDLRTPLSSLQAAVEALEDGVAADPDRYLRSMRRDVELLRDLVEDLFTLFRLESGRLELDVLAVDLGEIADGAVEAATPLAARDDIEVVLDANGNTPTNADPSALDRVLRNLLDNAIRHSPPGGTVRVEVGGTDGQAVVRVHDDGPGFPPAIREQAFEPFVRADTSRGRDRGRAGLGLAIARELLEAQHGTIGLCAPSDAVELTLPLAPPPPPWPPQPNSSSADGSASVRG